MTLWAASVGDILDATADALICSANPKLSLSGGVGGAFGLRYGDDMQKFLHRWFAQCGKQFVQPGEVVVAPPFGSSFKVVIHAVAVDSFYDTSPEIIRMAYDNSCVELANRGFRTVVAACLACGYGRASPTTFVDAVRPLLYRSWDGIDRIELISRDAAAIESVQNEIHKAANYSKGRPQR
jgi:O-acetyl-ADP-ribose deacetylase (regulator of RNase III)